VTKHDRKGEHGREKLPALHDSPMVLQVVRRSLPMAFVVRCAGIVVFAFLVSGCGGATETPAPTSAPAPPPSAPSAPAREPIAEATAEPALSASALAEAKAPFKGDLDAMATSGRIRILVAPSRTYYSVANNLQRGATYDAGVAFARFASARVGAGRAPLSVVFIPTAENALVADLLAGRGDIAANLRQTFERDDQVAFATPTLTGIRELVVTGPGQRPLVSLEDVAGRAIHVRKTSDHYASLVRLNEQLKKINRQPARIATVDEALTDEDLLDRVNEGTFPATLADEYVFDARQRELTSVAANKDVAVSQDGVIAWVTRKDSTQLLAVINAFFAAHKPRP
jgi:membrane-bound lytic murein transglycosylase MltF